MSGKVDRQRGLADADDHRVPGVRVLPAAVHEHDAGIGAAPAQRADFGVAAARFDPGDLGQGTRYPGLLGVFVQQREFGQARQFVLRYVGHVLDPSPGVYST